MSEHAHHRNYVKIWAILLGLLVVSVVGPMTGIRVVILITAFGVALVKAYMVAKNFMHVDVEKPIIHWMMAVALVLMVLLFAGVAPDVMKDKGQRWHKGPEFHVMPPPHHGAHAGAGAAGAHEGGTSDTPGAAAEATHDTTGNHH
jgi:caa(3)-type oxidase subunit IV